MPEITSAQIAGALINRALAPMIRVRLNRADGSTFTDNLFPADVELTCEPNDTGLWTWLYVYGGGYLHVIKPHSGLTLEIEAV
jgi:hypothetical protein